MAAVSISPGLVEPWNSRLCHGGGKYMLPEERDITVVLDMSVVKHILLDCFTYHDHAPECHIAEAKGLIITNTVRPSCLSVSCPLKFVR